MKERENIYAERKSGLLYLLLFMAIGMVIMSCGTEPDCASPSSSELKVGFSRIITEPDTAFIVADTVVFNRVYALSNRDSLIAKGDTLSFLTLPLKPDAEMVTFILENKRKGDSTEFDTDTVSFQYSIQRRLISPDCGLGIEYTHLEVSQNNTFDTVLIINNELNRDINAEVQIFR